MRLKVPDFGLVLMVGASGAGKTTFAQRVFEPTEILSSDHYRKVVGDNERSGRTTTDAFEIIEAIASRRLAARRLTVIDATNVQKEDRGRFVRLARQHHAPLSAIVLGVSEDTLQRHNTGRGEAARPAHVVRRQHAALRRGGRHLSKEGFRTRHELRDPEEIASAEIERVPLDCDRRAAGSLYDVIGDVHGCIDELVELLGRLGYAVTRKIGTETSWNVVPPAGRQAVFAGDLVDRGPDSAAVLDLALGMLQAGDAHVVPGNHENKLCKALGGRQVETAHGLAATLEALETRGSEFREKVRERLARLPSHLLLDRGRLVVAHAGLKESFHGRIGREVRDFAIYGDTTGDKDAEGHPVRRDWAREYRGRAAVVYGHTPAPSPEWVNGTVNIDQGCVFGGSLTALRWPERTFVSVRAGKEHAAPSEAFTRAREAQAGTAQQRSDELLDIGELTGKLHVHTRLMGGIRIREERTAAALETMNRYAVDPRWLIYLPPTMAPAEASTREGLLEHPEEAFAQYRTLGVEEVVCETKHMGSRGIVIVGRNPGAMLERFGIEAAGIVYTRTGRRFFDERDMNEAVVTRIRDAMEASGLWDELATDWACLDCEIMPWSAKGEGLIRQQYEPVGVAARMGLGASVDALEKAERRDPGNGHAELLDAVRERLAMTTAYEDAYKRYNWPVRTVDDLKVAPFQILATEGALHTGRSHKWQMATLARLCAAEPILEPTEYVTVKTTSETETRAAADWWTARTTAGSEGMVVKPAEAIQRCPRGLVVPALKCRGREYLRIIYGAEYTMSQKLAVLRKRSTKGKTMLSLKEFALGIEALEKFVERAPLRTVHKAVFGVLALESEPLDPRL